MVMAEVIKLINDLSKKFDTLQEDINNLKKHGGKQQRKKQAFPQVSFKVPDMILE